MLTFIRCTRWLALLVVALTLGESLPAGVKVALNDTPGWRQGGFWLPDVQLRLASCQPATLSGLLVRYGVVTVEQPRLTLTDPLRWRRDPTAGTLRGALKLTAKQVNFHGAGTLPATELALDIHGRNLQDFQWNGLLQAQAVGPIRLNGNRAGEQIKRNQGNKGIVIDKS
ncbi:hypothetical protein [Dickeya oryzae]|uniref:intermembrane phospholipid transport protein YdbH family protein n=1 Tax=Dickeya oryzae TaxID=1240404 RepID=UPI001FED4297|nr:hypothetical protein [Dickeya oryzae]